MQPPCFLLKRYLEVNPAFYRTSPLSFLVTPPVTFSHWLLALAAPSDASCRLHHTTPPVVPQPLFSTASWCSLCPFRRHLLVSSPVSLSAPPPGATTPFRAAPPLGAMVPRNRELPHQPSPNPASPDPARAQRLCSAPLSSDSIRTTLVRAKLLQSISSSVAVTTPDDRQ